MARSTDLTKGNITRGLWGFALPLMLGNVLQQLYNLVDTWVVGRYVGDNALAAVGSSYTLMTFLTSVIIGLCLGSSSFVSMAYGRKDVKAIRNGIFLSSSMIGAIAVVIMALFYILVDKIILLLGRYESLNKIVENILLIYKAIKWPITFLFIFFNIRLIYSIAPSYRIDKSSTTLGAFITTVGWVIATAIFSYYIKYFAKYDLIYGGLSSIIMLLIWFYILSFILILGIVINSTEYNKK